MQSQQLFHQLAALISEGDRSGSSNTHCARSLVRSHHHTLTLACVVASIDLSVVCRKKSYETRLSHALEHNAEIVGAVRHLATNVMRGGGAEETTDGGSINTKNMRASGSGLSAAESASASGDDGLHAAHFAHLPAKSSAASISLAGGLALNLAPSSSKHTTTTTMAAGGSAAAAAAQASAASGGAATPASSHSTPGLDAEVVAQLSREIASLEAEVPSLRALKSARSAAVHAAASRASLPPTRSFPLSSMVAELEVVSRGTSTGSSGGAPEIAAAYANLSAFLASYPALLAQLKFKLCTRWARFSVGLSTGLYDHVEHIEMMGTRFHEALKQVQHLHAWARNRRNEFGATVQDGGASDSGSSSSSGGGRMNVLHSSDVEAYLRWIIPSLSAGKDLSRFLLVCKWAGFTGGPHPVASGGGHGHAPAPAPALAGGAASEILAHFRQMRSNPHIMDRDEELKGLALGATSSASSASSSNLSSSSSSSSNSNNHKAPNLHALLADTRARVSHVRRRYVLHLPCLLLDEAGLTAAIARLGTLSLVTPLDYENGHPLLGQLLKVFPAIFTEAAKRRAARMRSSYDGGSGGAAQAAPNIESDRSAGIVYTKPANWIKFNRWAATGKIKKDKLNTNMQEKLNAVSQRKHNDCTQAMHAV